MKMKYIFLKQFTTIIKTIIIMRWNKMKQIPKRLMQFAYINADTS